MVQNTRCIVVLEVFKSLQLSAATMGRRSKSKRKEKRKQQRYNKRTRKRLCKAHLSIQPSERAEQTTSPGLFLVSQPGSPSSSQNQSATTFDSQLLPSYTQSELSSLFGSPSSPPPSLTISPSPLSTPLEAESPLANENDSTNILGMDHIHNNGLNNAHRTPGVLELEQLPTHFCMKNTALFACCTYAYTIQSTCLVVSPREQSSGK